MNDGLTCPECGSCRLFVQQTVPGSNSTIRRRRCANGHLFVTKEVQCDTEEYNQWQREERRLREGGVQ